MQESVTYDFVDHLVTSPYEERDINRLFVAYQDFQIICDYLPIVSFIKKV
jgi:hypothetical protein